MINKYFTGFFNVIGLWAIVIKSTVSCTKHYVHSLFSCATRSANHKKSYSISSFSTASISVISWSNSQAAEISIGTAMPKPSGITMPTINGIEGISVIIILSLLLSIVLITLSYLLSIRKWDAEKLSPYECGFEPFGDAKQKFDIRYYLVSLLFILFDLEVSYLFPLIAVDHCILTHTGYILGAIFIVILTVGFIYEYSKEALDNI